MPAIDRVPLPDRIAEPQRGGAARSIWQSAAASCAALLALAGCTVGPNYQPPAPPSAAFKLTPQRQSIGPEPHAGGEAPERWWTTFHDPELESLIGRALRGNRDVKVAVLRVRAAREQRAVVAGGLLPSLEATAGYNRGRGSKNVVLPLGGGSAAPASGSSGGSRPGAASGAPGRPGVHADEAGAGGGLAPGGATGGGNEGGAPPGGPNTPFGEGGLPGVTTNLWQAGFDAVYEFDLFGGTRRAIEAVDAQTAAAVEGERGVEVTLLAEVARTYLQLREAQAREAIARRNLETQRESWKIADDKFRSGLGNEAQAAQEGAQVHLTEAMLPPLAAQEQASRQALAFLLGLGPNALDGELAAAGPEPALPSDLPLGLASDLIRRRPDIREAERQLAAANAEVGVAMAELFPRFSITGSFGWDSSTLKHLTDWGSHYYSVAPGVHWPILNWTQLRATVRVQNLLQEQALLAYEKTVEQALREVQDALVRYEGERERRHSLEQAAAEGRRALRVARQTYTAGLADQLQTLESERFLLQAEDALAQSDAGLRVDLVALFKALGGGWEQNLPN